MKGQKKNKEKEEGKEGGERKIKNNNNGDLTTVRGDLARGQRLWLCETTSRGAVDRCRTSEATLHRAADGGHTHEAISCRAADCSRAEATSRPWEKFSDEREN